MNKRKFLGLLLSAFPALALAQKNRQKFYITGLGHTDAANDCTIPVIVAYGTNRTNALLNCCEGGSLTVWTEDEFNDMRRSVGTIIDEGCKAVEQMKRKKVNQQTDEVPR